MEEYFKICLRHMGKDDNCFLLWGEGSAGYYRNLSSCGTYTIGEHKSYLLENNRDDFLVSKELVSKYKQKVILPSYGDKKELYAGENEFYVLPNTGQVRKALKITTLDIQLDGNRNSFTAYFDDIEIEVFKYEHSKTHFHVRAKEYVSEYWHLDGQYEAENRNKAILMAFNDWIPDDYDTYIAFKNKSIGQMEKIKIESGRLTPIKIIEKLKVNENPCVNGYWVVPDRFKMN